jgi:hypothetical protein
MIKHLTRCNKKDALTPAHIHRSKKSHSDALPKNLIIAYPCRCHDWMTFWRPTLASSMHFETREENIKVCNNNSENIVFVCVVQDEWGAPYISTWCTKSVLLRESNSVLICQLLVISVLIYQLLITLYLIHHFNWVDSILRNNKAFNSAIRTMQ